MESHIFIIYLWWISLRLKWHQVHRYTEHLFCWVVLSANSVRPLPGGMICIIRQQIYVLTFHLRNLLYYSSWPSYLNFSSYSFPIYLRQSLKSPSVSDREYEFIYKITYFQRPSTFLSPRVFQYIKLFTILYVNPPGSHTSFLSDLVRDSVHLALALIGSSDLEVLTDVASMTNGKH